MADRPQITDVRSRLPKANLEWLSIRPLSHVEYLFVHYTADSLSAQAAGEEEVQHLIADANYHISKTWGYDGNGNPIPGYALMYTYAVFQSGRIYWCNDEDWLLWNTTYGNAVGLAIVCVLGPGETPSPAMLASLTAYLDWMDGRADIPARRASVFGHGECDRQYGQGPAFGNNTDCPGGVLSFVRQYRAGTPPPPPPPPPPAPPPATRFFPETGHNLSHGFLDFWSRNGALPIFGYPLTEEIDGAAYGRAGLTIQWLERACFEYHPATSEITLRLLGVEGLANALHPAIQDH